MQHFYQLRLVRDTAVGEITFPTEAIVFQLDPSEDLTDEQADAAADTIAAGLKTLYSSVYSSWTFDRYVLTTTQTVTVHDGP